MIINKRFFPSAEVRSNEYWQFEKTHAADVTVVLLEDAVEGPSSAAWDILMVVVLKALG